jgi:hypothetical protein
MQQSKKSGILTFQMIWKFLSAIGCLPEMLVMFYYYVKTGNVTVKNVERLGIKFDLCMHLCAWPHTHAH